MSSASPFEESAAAIDAAAEPLYLLWERSAEQIHPRISTSQLRVLLVVERHGAINLRGLSDEIGAIASSASRLCDRLQAAGLLVRRPAPHDRREIMLRLTGDGSRLLGRFQEIRRRELAVRLAEITPRTRAELLAALTALGTESRGGESNRKRA